MFRLRGEFLSIQIEADVLFFPNEATRTRAPSGSRAREERYMVSRLVDVYDGEMILEQATNDDSIARHLVKDVCPCTLLQGPSPLQQVL